MRYIYNFCRHNFFVTGVWYNSTEHSDSDGVCRRAIRVDAGFTWLLRLLYVHVDQDTRGLSQHQPPELSRFEMWQLVSAHLRYAHSFGIVLRFFWCGLAYQCGVLITFCIVRHVSRWAKLIGFCIWRRSPEQNVEIFFEKRVFIATIKFYHLWNRHTSLKIQLVLPGRWRVMIILSV